MRGDKISLSRILLFCGLIHALSFHNSFASVPLAPVTNTGLKNIHFKSVRCSDSNLWMIDVVNNSFSRSYIEYFFWLEDEHGDAVKGDSGQLVLDAKSRESITLNFPCEIAFTELRQHFCLAQVGFTRP